MPGIPFSVFVRIFAALDNQRKGMISIIVCSINPDAAEKLKQNIAATIGRVEYEVIVLITVRRVMESVKSIIHVRKRAGTISFVFT